VEIIQQPHITQQGVMSDSDKCITQGDWVFLLISRHMPKAAILDGGHRDGFTIETKKKKKKHVKAHGLGRYWFPG